MITKKVGIVIESTGNSQLIANCGLNNGCPQTRMFAYESNMAVRNNGISIAIDNPSKEAVAAAREYLNLIEQELYPSK